MYTLKCVRENDLIYYTKKKVAVNMHNLGVSAVSGGSYRDSNVSCGYETYADSAAIFSPKLITPYTDNNFAANDTQLGATVKC